MVTVNKALLTDYGTKHSTDSDRNAYTTPYLTYGYLLYNTDLNWELGFLFRNHIFNVIDPTNGTTLENYGTEYNCIAQIYIESTLCFPEIIYSIINLKDMFRLRSFLLHWR